MIITYLVDFMQNGNVGDFSSARYFWQQLVRYHNNNSSKRLLLILNNQIVWFKLSEIENRNEGETQLLRPPVWMCSRPTLHEIEWILSCDVLGWPQLSSFLDSHWGKLFWIIQILLKIVKKKFENCLLIL